MEQNDADFSYTSFRFSRSQTHRNSAAVSPFGGRANFIAFLDQIGFARQVESPLPWRLTSPNAIPPGARWRRFSSA
jgi:hypothetical protein